MTGIFVYLTVCSIRNSVRLRIRRLRRPRYLLIAVGFVLWVGSMLLGRRTSGPLGFIAVDGARAQLIAAGVATVMLGSAWLLPLAAALRFTSAEVQFLFTAPITRRQLIGYKVCRLLLGATPSGPFLAILVGTTFQVLTRSYRDSEMTVWFTSGLSIAAWIRPVLAFALPVALVCALLSLAVAPWSQAQSVEYQRLL